jgi:hypothetical protein
MRSDGGSFRFGDDEHSASMGMEAVTGKRHSGCAVHSLGPGTHHLGASDMTQREVEIVVGMVLVFIAIVLLLGAWPDAPARALLGVWVIAAMSLALWRILIRDDE